MPMVPAQLLMVDWSSNENLTCVLNSCDIASDNNRNKLKVLSNIALTSAKEKQTRNSLSLFGKNRRQVTNMALA
jgi:hypothetical protein